MSETIPGWKLIRQHLESPDQSTDILGIATQNGMLLSNLTAAELRAMYWTMPETITYQTKKMQDLGKNVFENLNYFSIQPPKDVCIVGTGPSVTHNLFRLPEDTYRIALNAAILLPLRFDYHMVIDYRFPLDNPPAWKNTRHVKRINGELVTDDRTDFVINPNVNSPYVIGPQLIHGMGTVAGCALSMCAALWHHYGWPERVHMTGIDMGGDRYHDGGETRQQGAWGQADAMNKIIEACEGRGMDVYHYGETLLNVRRRV